MNSPASKFDRSHRIQLRGPWEWLRLEGGEASGTAKLPASWRDLFGDIAGRVRFRRRFHRPTNLEPHEHVFLVFDGVGGAACIALNGEPIGEIAESTSSAEFDVTNRLEPSNILEVEIEFHPSTSPGSPGGLWGPVAIEIRSKSGAK